MAKLKTATRNRLPSSALGLPTQRKYPMEDRGHQIAAKERPTELRQDLIRTIEYRNKAQGAYLRAAQDMLEGS